MRRSSLEWPVEAASATVADFAAFAAPGSNIALDFHGDPVAAGAVVYSDGNHHMALEEALAAFRERNPDIGDIFYATTPPGVLAAAVRSGGLRLGNLAITRAPDVFIGPPAFLDDLVSAGATASHEPFMQSRGNVLLVRKGNPKRVQGLADLMRDDVVLAISNPVTERASHDVYRATMLDLAAEQGLARDALLACIEADGVVHSAAIHHREIPEILAGGEADVSVVYHHLGLRYARIFPDLFETIALTPLAGEPGATPANQTTLYRIGVAREPGEWGRPIADFLLGEEGGSIYARHGLMRPVS